MPKSASTTLSLRFPADEAAMVRVAAERRQTTVAAFIREAAILSAAKITALELVGVRPR